MHGPACTFITQGEVSSPKI
ncbi:hypothetical protein AOCH_007655 [Aspergillus ochraceoroseus]|uniref:Uncharacterized protein n=1 Tax=Aspergillus ochraceoroseus TaxID=138278 RepID=A0A0F8WVG2_9EURO|nr:hypothetical protein AOCH_007655 [Aspergillus ochraceoroseus]